MSQSTKSKRAKGLILPDSYSVVLRPKCPRIGKAMWDSKKIAKIQAEHFRRNTGDKMGVYRCRYCKGWHIGHKSKYKARKKGSSQSATLTKAPKP